METKLKILILVNHYPISPRVTKICHSIEELICNVEIKIIAWDRENKNKIENGIVTYSSNVGYGKRLKKLMDLFSFSKFVKNKVGNEEYDYIHCIDWDMLLVGSFIKKKSKIIYEVYDLPDNGNIFIGKIQKSIETIFLKKVYKIILSSEFFSHLYPKNESIVINNKPNKLLSEKSINIPKEKKKFTVGFIGNVRYIDILKNLVDAIKGEDIDLFFAGRGTDLTSLRDYCVDINNVSFTGEYNYKNIRELYESCDLVWAAYPYEDNNVKYATSNKYYESMILNVPSVYSMNTFLGEKVKKNKTGFVVNPYDVKSINILLTELKDNVDILENCKKTIEDNYSDDLFWETEEKKILGIYK